MDKKDAKLRIFKLTELINKYRKEYYELDNPTISDYEYDSLIRNLEELEKEYEKAKKIEHKIKAANIKIKNDIVNSLKI